MRESTQSMIRQLEGLAWFHAVGKPVEEPCIRARDWNEAITYCSSEQWEGITLNAANDRTSVLYLKVHPDWSARRWGALGEELKTALQPALDRLDETISTLRLTPPVGDCVRWDIFGFCQETEFAEYAIPNFFRRLGKFYLLGHFPCGWRGAFPKGKLVVY